MITHIVLIRFPAHLAESAILDLLIPFTRLPSVIPGLLTVSAGPNASPENLGNGYRHGLVMRFESAASRDAYLPHPAHMRLAEPLVAALANGTGDVAVFDLETAEA